MTDGDIFSSLHLTAQDTLLTVEDAHQKIVATQANTFSTGNGQFSTIINNNYVSQGDFSRYVNDFNLHSDLTYPQESLVYQNADISGQTNSTTALQWSGTSATPTGAPGVANPNTLLPFINTTQSVSCVGSDYVPNTNYQLTDYTLFQSVIQNTIFEGFGAYSTTQGFQQNLVNLILTDDSQLYGGYNFGTSSRLPLIMFDITRQFLNTKLGLRWITSQVQTPGDAEILSAGNGTDPHHVDHDSTTQIVNTADHAPRLQLALAHTALLKTYKSAVWSNYLNSYTTHHEAENLTAEYLKGPNSDDARAGGPNGVNCHQYIQQITEENSQNAAHGENDYIEITMEEVRRELFKTLACPELFGQIFYDQKGVDWEVGPSGALTDETEFEYDQNDVNTWKGGQIRISNINEARLWLLQYRNWLIHKLKTHRVYNRVQKNTHPLLKDVDNVEEFFYNLDTFTIALITGGASLTDLYANALDVHQNVQFTTEQNSTIGNPLKRCGLLSNNDFLRWAHIGSASIAVANTDTHAAVVTNGGVVATNGNISGVYYEQQTLGYGQQIGGDTLFGMKVTGDTPKNLDTVLSIGDLSTTGKQKYQYRNSDATKLDISGVNFNPYTSKFDSGSSITSFTYEPNLENNWWADQICAGIAREWVLPINLKSKLTSGDLLNVSEPVSNQYYTSSSTDTSVPELLISTNVSSVLNGETWVAQGRGNPGFLTNDVFNVSNWAWAKYVNGQHKPESNNHGDGNSAELRHIDDFIVDLTISQRNATLDSVTADKNNQHQHDTVHPKIQDPRQVTRTLCHNAFGASIKILDPIRQLYDACSSGHTWLTTENGHLITTDGNTPKTVDRRLGFGFCLGDLISVGQSHHFNLGSRITTGTKKRASIRKSNQHVQLPVEFNAVVNCEFALMFNVVDRCTDTVSTRYANIADYELKLKAGIDELTRPSTKQKSIYNLIGDDTIQLSSTDSDNWCDLRGDLFNDVYNLSLLYLARNDKLALKYFNITDVADIKVFAEDTDISYDGVTISQATDLHHTNQASEEEPWNRYILEADKETATAATTSYSPGRDNVRGTNLIFKSPVTNTYRYPAQEDASAIATFYAPASVATNGDIDVSTGKDILNLWWDYIKADSSTLFVKSAGNLYSEIYKEITTDNALITQLPTPDNLVSCNMWVPVWNTAVLRHASVIDDDVLRGNTTLPIDPDLQSGAMIGIDQIVTTENSITGQIGFVSQPNPLLFSTDGTPNGGIADRILPHATLNQGSIAGSSQGAMVNTEAPETGNNILNEEGGLSGGGV